MIKVKLGYRNSLWFLLDKKIYLTSSNPGPIDLDFDSLSTKEKTQVIMGLRNGLIEAPEESFQNLVLRARGLIAPVAVISNHVDNVASLPKNSEDVFQDKAAELLALGVQKLRKQVESIDDSRVLDAMIKLESEGKKRKSLLLLLHQAKSRLAWLKQPSPSAKSGDSLVRTFESAIEDEVIGTVKIKVGAEV